MSLLHDMKLKMGDGQCLGLLFAGGIRQGWAVLVLRGSLLLSTKFSQAVSQILTTQLIILGQDNPSLSSRPNI